MTLYQHQPHPHIEARQQAGPPTHRDAAAASRRNGLSAWLAVRITSAVGTMACAGLFALVALVALPQALHDGFHGGLHPLPLVAWLSQAFLQLVLLSILLVGGNLSAAAADARADATYRDAEAVLHECLEIHAHLEEQDKVLLRMMDARYGPAVPPPPPERPKPTRPRPSRAKAPSE